MSANTDMAGFLAEAVLTVDEMYRADALAIEAGIPGERLMETAGAAVAGAVLDMRAQLGLTGTTVVLCGPGNNGGDGFVAARHLHAAGRSVRLALLGEPSALSGDAALHAGRWDGSVEQFDPTVTAGCSQDDIIVDAVFGAGLSRPVDGIVAATLGSQPPHPGVAHRVAVDVPSGLDGDTGQVRGSVVAADMTVTFLRRKPGHLLLPGRDLCGALRVVDIGIPDTVLEEIRPACAANGPAVWQGALPPPGSSSHKYTRGHVVVAGGSVATGAARLAATAALRIGAGMVTIASPVAAAATYRSGIAAVIVREIAGDADFVQLIEDRRVGGLVLGPGNGITGATRGRALAALATGKPCVLDADALSVFADDPAALWAAIQGPCVLTPHDGEFARLFGADDGTSSRLARARRGAAESGAVVLLKGGDTVVAMPDGRAVINSNGPPWLATAGSGDVLAGMIGGLLTQGVAPFQAAAAAAWLHGAAAHRLGRGLIADDLPEGIAAVMGEGYGIDGEPRI